MLGLGSSLLHPSGHEQLYSVSFDGTDDYITLGDVLDLGTADFSISLWVKLADISGKNLITKHEDSNNQIVIYFSGEKIVANLQGGGENICTHVGANNMTALQNTWIHICVSMDRDGNGGVYVNGTTTTYGKALHDLDADTQTLSNSGSWYFMRYGSSYTAGEMTDVAIWNVALDADAVTAVYNSGKPFDLTSDRGNYDNSSALQGYWKMNDGSGTTAVDSSGNGNDGTLTGGPTWSADTPDD
jgi:hypothetical protein